MAFHFTQKTKLSILLSGSIIILIVLSAFFGLTIKQDEMIRHYIYHTASSYFDSILLTRRWNANYGGVYVEKKDGMTSNPYLRNPDISTGNGRIFTLKNPALMTREISQMAALQAGYQYHITSLKTLNAGNAPDEWERQALARFERGEKEASQIVVKNGKTQFRLMRPLHYEQGCISCHAQQGYQIGDVRGGISVSLPYEEISAELKMNRFKMFGLAAGILLVLGITFYCIIWRLVHRLSVTSSQLEEEKNKLERLNSELDQRIEARTRELAVTNDQLRAEIAEGERIHKELMEREVQLRHAQRMEAVGQLASGVAHDFNNILTVITGYGEMLQDRFPAGDSSGEKIGQIIKAANRASNLTRSLLVFSRKQIMEPTTLNLNDILHNLDKFLRRIIGEGVSIKTTIKTDPIIIHADQSQIEQVIMNLATNARDAMHSEGTLSIETDIIHIDQSYVAAHGYGEPGYYALMLVSDTGVGIDKDSCMKIFEPFYTTKEVGKGTGLGLSIVHGIIMQHKGHISVYSEVGVGTTFRIMLPIHPGAAVELKPDKAIPPSGSETILVAEDDEPVRNLIIEILSCCGYRIIPAVNGREAVEIVRDQPEAIDMLLIDVIMPVMNGVIAAGKIKDIRPEIKVLFTSGYTSDIVMEKVKGFDSSTLLIKPIHPVQLAQKVREVLDAQ